MNDQSISDYLLAHVFFSQLSEDAILFLCDNVMTHKVKKGEFLFRQGEPADKFYLICSGHISVQIPALFGPTLEIQSLSHNQILGWSWLIAPYQWTFQAKAVEDSNVYEFDGVAILARCEENPKFGYELFKRFTSLMSERLESARQKMMNEWNPSGFA